MSLQRRLGVADLTLIAIGAVIGSGIFRNPSVVAQRAHEPALIIGCWVAGGVLALIGAFVFAELAARHPVSGGLYAYLRDAYHPVVAFIFGWTSLLIADTGGTAAAAVLFSDYFVRYIEQPFGGGIEAKYIAALALLIVGAINILGVRQGSTWQHILVTLKVAAIGAVIAGGIFGHPLTQAPPLAPLGGSLSLITALGFAMVPVLFAYNGFQGATYLTAETIEPELTLPRGLIYGVSAVVAIYVLANIGYLHILGAGGLAATKTPAADVMQAAIGNIGGQLVAIAIVISTLGFISTRMLLAPRMYFQMAADGTFFKVISWISPRTHVPAVAIGLQAVLAASIAFFAGGSFDRIVNWVTGPEWLFILLAAVALFIFRRRAAGSPPPSSRVPGHPYTTGLLIVSIVGVFVAEFATAPLDTVYGIAVLASGALFYLLWRSFKRSAA